MPFNGSGVFQRVRNWVADATAGIKIRADYHDAEDDGFAAGLTNCITKDGQSVIAQNIPWNSKRITGLADPINPQDAATMASVSTLTADKLPLTGGTITGNLSVTGNISAASATINGLLTAVAATVSGDITVYRAGAPATGYVFLGNSGGRYFGCDGTNMVVQGAPLVVTSNLSVSGNVNVGAGLGVAAQVSANYFVSSAHMTVGNGVLYMRNDNGVYFQWAGDHYNAPQGPIVASNGRLWGSGDLGGATPIVNGRLAMAGDTTTLAYGHLVMGEPFAGSVITGFGSNYSAGYGIPAMFRSRYLQLFTTGWFTVGYA